MKILSIAELDMSKTDACVVHVTDLAQAMRDNGHKVDIVVISTKSSVVRMEGLKVYVLPKWTHFWIFKGILCNLWSWLIIFNRLRHMKYDVLYVRYSPHIALVSRLMSKRLPVWLEINGIFSSEDDFLRKRFWHIGRAGIGIWIEGFTYKHADRLVCVTPLIADYIVHRFNVLPEKIRVVPNGVDIETYSPMDKKACRRALGLDEDILYIGFIGNFAGWQGIDNIIEIMPSILKDYQNCYVMLVGDGEYLSEYKKMAEQLGIADKIVFPGRVHKDQAALWINSFDIGVVLKRPIASGYSPLKLYSYMACGIPVIATDTDGFEIVKQYAAGILVPSDNRQELRRALISLLSDAGLRIAYGLNGRRCAEDQFSWKKIAGEILKP